MDDSGMRCYHHSEKKPRAIPKSPQPNSLPSKGKDLPHIMEQPKPLSPAHKALGYCVLHIQW